MPSFDVVSEIDWQELDNARNQALKEVGQRFDFKNAKCEIDVSQKDKLVQLSSSAPEKINAFSDVFRTKLAKRGLSLMAFDFQPVEEAGGGSARQKANIVAGIDKERAKKVVKVIKDGKFKVQAQIQDEQIRVSSKKIDELQEVIAFLKGKQDELKLPMQFGNFRD